jgi:hypothetical protein
VSGERRELDTGPAAPESLTLSGYTASWLHEGAPRSALLR